MYWSAELVALVPPVVVTVMSTVPAVPAGEVAVIWVSLSTVKLCAGVLPKLTAVAPVKPVPVIVTVVPPVVGPAVGLHAGDGRGAHRCIGRPSWWRWCRLVS